MLRAFCFVVVVLLTPTVVVGQVGIAFEFSLSNPGARSMGLGGAFVALADDATAAFANPAGLVQLSRPEVSAEVRQWRYSVPFAYTGRVTGEPTGIGLDTRNDVEQRRFDDNLTDVSFLSFVYPKKRWSIAVYRHLLANFRLVAETQGLFAEDPGAPFDTARLLEHRDITELELVTYGLSGAFKVSERLSLGLTFNYFDSRLRGTQDRYLWDEDTPEGYFGPTSFLPEKLVGGSLFEADGTDTAFSAGILWSPADGWSLGGFYRQAPTFDFGYAIFAGPASGDPSRPPGARFETNTRIDYPDVYGAGIAYRAAGGRLTLSFEWDHVGYSSLFDSLGLTTSGEFIPDGDEYHLGAEYAFLRSKPLIAVRAGVWRDPNHQVQSSLGNPLLDGLLGEGGDQTHYAVGFGTAFERFQIDLGVDLSDVLDQFSISGIFSW